MTALQVDDSSRGTSPPTVLGLDRSTIKPTAWILAAVLFFLLVVPGVNAIVQRSGTIGAGTVFPVGLGVTFVPSSSWSYGAGHQGAATQQPGGAEITSNGVTLELDTGGWGGSLSEFQRTVTEHAGELHGLGGHSSTTSVTTSQGVPGVLTTHRMHNRTALTYAFVDKGAAVRVLVQGPPASVAHELGAVHRMVDSIRFPADPSPTAREATKDDRSGS